MGQRIVKFHVDVVNKDCEWLKVLSGTTVGYRRIIRFPSVGTQSLRLVIDKSRSDPLVAFLGLYVDTVLVIRNTRSNRTTNLSSYTNFNGSQVLHQIVKSRDDGDDASAGNAPSIKAISERFVNTTYGFFLGKRVAYPIVANYVRNTWGKFRSSYARAMIELRANMELRDNIVAAMPKITGE
ncbi:alpha-L-fucosidase 1 [Tanacetum coccineum]